MARTPIWWFENTPMAELFSYAFMQRALLAGAIIGVTCAVMGVFVIYRRLAFMGAGIAHASFGGVALGFWLGINPVLGAIGFCLLVGWSIGALSLKTAVREDTVVGIFFASTMALGILLISLVGGFQQELFGYLFGSILSVTREDIWIILVVGLAVGFFLLAWGKELVFTIFDPQGAAVSGIPTGMIYFLLITLITLTVVISIKVVGIVLVSALLITPAATASLLSKRFSVILLLAALIGLGSTQLGLLLSYWWNTPSGATIVLIVTGIFLIAAPFGLIRR